MHSQKLGYYLICISPLMSLLAVWLVVYGTIGSVLYFHDWRTPLIATTLANTFIIGFQMCGLLLYLNGYRRKKEKLARSLYTKLIAVSLIVWGIIVSWFMYTIYHYEVILWSMEPDVRDL